MFMSAGFAFLPDFRHSKDRSVTKDDGGIVLSPATLSLKSLLWASQGRYSPQRLSHLRLGQDGRVINQPYPRLRRQFSLDR